MNVLILRLSSLGDVILVSSVLDAIKKTHLKARIHCLVKPAYAAALSAHPAADAVIPFHDFWSAWRELRAMHWDALLDLHGTLRTRLLSRLIPASRKAVYDKDSAARRLLVLFKKRSSHRSVLRRYMEAALRLGLVNSAEAQHRLPPPSKTEDTVAFLMNSPQTVFTVGLAPGARWRTKRWLPERFAELAHLLKTAYPNSRFLLLGGEEDKAVCAEIAAKIAECRPLNMAGTLNLSELMRVISQCSLFISNDSGPMHIAAGYGVPTVAVFGPTTREFGFFPQGGRSRVVEADLGCRPCSLHGGEACPRGHFLCMRLIGAEEVFNACKVAIGGSPGREASL